MSADFGFRAQFTGLSWSVFAPSGRAVAVALPEPEARDLAEVLNAENAPRPPEEPEGE